jgi:uncharacterized protein YjiS (DUF1127 family)
MTHSHAARSSGAIVPAAAPFAARVGATLGTLATWIALRRQRLALADLAERNDYLLQDVGIARGDALDEAAKPFWKR